MKTHILITDDESLTRKSLQETLRYEGYNVSTAEDGYEALQIMKQSPVDVIFADIKMPGLDGIALLKEIKKEYPKTQVVIMSGYGNIENAVEAMRLGAFDFMTKPVADKQIKSVIEKIEKQGENGNGKSKKQIKKTEATTRNKFYGMIGQDEKMQKIYNIIESIALAQATVLIYGESGTGKRMVAQAIHQFDSERSKNSFIEVSCGALPETLLESELFGHVKGAFTGAIKDRPGRFELADGGTILLDEIDTCSPSLQVKLLRVLEEGTFERVGDTKTQKVNVRIIAATNQNLEELVRRKSFREDLYWRLNVIYLQIPPLRERKEDIPLLIEHFLGKYNGIRANGQQDRAIEKASEEALLAMINYSWPGNIRELENTIERACILVKNEVIHLSDLPDSIRNGVYKHEDNKQQENSYKLKEVLKNPEKDAILKALERTNWNCTKTAIHLGINRTTLYNKMKLYGIKRMIRQTNELANEPKEIIN